MSKLEAIRAMEQGKRVTHQYFAADECISIENDMIITEEGYTVTKSLFFGIRTGEGWEAGWSLYKPKIK